MSEVSSVPAAKSSPPKANLLWQDKRQLLRVFWCVSAGLIGYELLGTTATPGLDNLGAVLITAAALFPIYLWCAQKVQGIPVFPLFALTHIWTHALPLVSNHRHIIKYAVENRFLGSLTVFGYLLLATIIWQGFVRTTPPPPRYYRTLEPGKGDRFFLWILALATLFYMAEIGGWLANLPFGIFTVIRSAMMGLSAIAAFVLCYKLGRKELNRQQSRLLIVLVISNMVCSAVGFLIVYAASIALISTIAYVVGSRKVPFLMIGITFVCLSLLHYGKADMRDKYWSDIPAKNYVQPAEYVGRYSEWLNYGFNYVIKGQDSRIKKSEERESLVERSSTLHMLLLAQKESPDPVPFMDGATYEIIPQVLVPRILNANKIRSHEGTYMLSVHYGLQTYKQTFTTTIGWGLLAESYANFGIFGCAGLAVLLGCLYGKVTRWSINAPILSAPSLFTVLMATFAMQTEWTAGVYVATLFQSGLVLLAVVFIFMRKYPGFVHSPLNPATLKATD